MLKVLAWLVGGALGLIVLYVATALLLGAIPINRDSQAASSGVPIAVCSNGVHTDFVLPVKTAEVDWSAAFPPVHYPIDVTGFDHIGIGWGDLDFYKSTPSWADFDTRIALKALTGLGPAALHVQYRPGPGATEDCRPMTISVPQYRALSDYIGATMASPGWPAAPGYGATDLFYAAHGHFSLIKSCNVWVGEGLKAAGLPTGLWTPFAFQVLNHL
ncbi:MAG TPA: TIGR02117 family protein [Reyranella sp.]|nr:TIGR02117 family protein [Reyranella sp.]